MGFRMSCGRILITHGMVRDRGLFPHAEPEKVKGTASIRLGNG